MLCRACVWAFQPAYSSVFHWLTHTYRKIILSGTFSLVVTSSRCTHFVCVSINIFFSFPLFFLSWYFCLVTFSSIVSPIFFLFHFFISSSVFSLLHYPFPLSHYTSSFIFLSSSSLVINNSFILNPFYLSVYIDLFVNQYISCFFFVFFNSLTTITPAINFLRLQMNIALASRCFCYSFLPIILWSGMNIITWQKNNLHFHLLFVSRLSKRVMERKRNITYQCKIIWSASNMILYSFKCIFHCTIISNLFDYVGNILLKLNYSVFLTEGVLRSLHLCKFDSFYE